MMENGRPRKSEMMSFVHASMLERARLQVSTGPSGRCIPVKLWSEVVTVSRRGIDHRCRAAGPANAGERTGCVWLETLVRNLIDNAIRHNTPGGQVEVSTQRRAGHPVLTVINTGPVVPASEIERLPQPFQRAAIGRTAQSDGSGLGLSIVLAVATAHNANLTLDPQQEGGLRIEVSFPVQPHVIPTTPGVLYRSRVMGVSAGSSEQ
jgi:signal transduction histidine kinase